MPPLLVQFQQRLGHLLESADGELPGLFIEAIGQGQIAQDRKHGSSAESVGGKASALEVQPVDTAAIVENAGADGW